MPEEVRKKVTFDDALPRGVCATFTHDDQLWMAYPQDKVVAVRAVIDRLIGVLDAVQRELVWRINQHPEDAVWVASLLRRTNKAQEIAREKAEAWTL